MTKRLNEGFALNSTTLRRKRTLKKLISASYPFIGRWTKSIQPCFAEQTSNSNSNHILASEMPIEAQMQVKVPTSEAIN